MTEASHNPYAPPDPVTVEARISGLASGSDQGVSPETEAVQVPKGTSAEVLAWVGLDSDRAQLALDAEQATAKPRKGLVEELEELLGE
jgi:hypothetical protein